MLNTKSSLQSIAEQNKKTCEYSPTEKPLKIYVSHKSWWIHNILLFSSLSLWLWLSPCALAGCPVHEYFKNRCAAFLLIRPPGHRLSLAQCILIVGYGSSWCLCQTLQRQRHTKNPFAQLAPLKLIRRIDILLNAWIICTNGADRTISTTTKTHITWICNDIALKIKHKNIERFVQYSFEKWYLRFAEVFAMNNTRFLVDCWQIFCSLLLYVGRLFSIGDCFRWASSNVRKYKWIYIPHATCIVWWTNNRIKNWLSFNHK